MPDWWSLPPEWVEGYRLLSETYHARAEEEAERKKITEEQRKAAGHKALL